MFNDDNGSNDANSYSNSPQMASDAQRFLAKSDQQVMMSDEKRQKLREMEVCTIL